MGCREYRGMCYVGISRLIPRQWWHLTLCLRIRGFWSEVASLACCKHAFIKSANLVAVVTERQMWMSQLEKSLINDIRRQAILSICSDIHFTSLTLTEWVNITFMYRKIWSCEERGLTAILCEVRLLTLVRDLSTPVQMYSEWQLF